MSFTVEQRARCAAWFETMSSATLVQRKFHSVYGKNMDAPSSKIIKKWHTQLIETGSVLQVVRKRQKPLTSEEFVAKVTDHFDQYPHSSLRRASVSIGISRESVRRCLTTAKWHPYKIHVVQSLSEEDYACRLNFAADELSRIANNPKHLENLTFSDEAHFHIDGNVNRHNHRYWAPTNPHWSTEKGLHSPKTTVWAAISRKKVYGPFFFDQTITSERYLEMLQQSFYASLTRREKQTMIFMQDGAPPHWGLTVRAWLNDKFQQRWMGRGSPNMPWPPRSPDVTPCDYFLWGFIKSRVYAIQSTDIPALQQNIREAYRLVTPQMLNDVFTNYEQRLQRLIYEKGKHIETY
jgi:hypothetical protein